MRQRRSHTHLASDELESAGTQLRQAAALAVLPRAFHRRMIRMAEALSKEARREEVVPLTIEQRARKLFGASGGAATA